MSSVLVLDQIFFWNKNIQDTNQGRKLYKVLCHGSKLKQPITRRNQQKHRCNLWKRTKIIFHKHQYNWFWHWWWHGFKWLCHIKKSMLFLDAKMIPKNLLQEQVEPKTNHHSLLQELVIPRNHQMWHQIKDVGRN